jgi:DNA-binding NtrC family response regulator
MKILLADDEKSIAVTLGDTLRGAGHDVTVAPDGTAACNELKAGTFDCVITDIRMPGVDGMEVFRQARKIQPNVKVILMTAYANIEDCVAAMKDGAEDYIQKPFFNEDVLARLEKIRKVMRLEAENQELRDQLADRKSLGNIIGKSDRMQKVYELILSVAPTDTNVLVEGESGTGKELAAEAIHFNSGRKKGPLVKMSCSVFPEGLIDSERCRSASLNGSAARGRSRWTFAWWRPRSRICGILSRREASGRICFIA